MKIFLRREFLKRAILALLFPAFLIACGGGSSNSTPTKNVSLRAANTASTPRLGSVNNFRDIAIGDNPTPYRNINGQPLRQGVLYRANELTASPEDLAILNTLGIRAVYDLRTPAEIVAAPDVLPKGAMYSNINILDRDSPPVPVGIDSPEKTIAYMESLNREFVTDAKQRAKFAELLKAIATSSDNAQLFHCTSGKDRTGWATAVLLSLAGVPKEVIIYDYLLTNTYMASTIAAIYESLLINQGKRVADIYRPALGVQQTFIEASFDQILTSYGSMSGYINFGLGLDALTQTKLRNKLLN